MSVEFHAEELSQAVPADIALCFYRVAQEALSNAAKYSGASRTAVSLSNGNAVLTMRISDSGKGFDTGWPSKGLGLASMHERLRLVNGKLVVTSRLGVGTELIAQVLLIQPTQEQRAS